MTQRQKQRLFRYAVDLFVQLLQQVTGNRVNYKCNDKDVDCWNSFIETYGDGVGENFIREFAEYGMQSWFNSGSQRDYTHAVRFNWIFSKSAIKRWDALPGHVRTKVVRKNLKKNAKIDTTKKSSTLTELLLTVRESEERFKREYYNTPRGLLWCIANTTLFFHKSALCVGCKFKDDCKEALKDNFPKLYVKRGYGKK